MQANVDVIRDLNTTYIDANLCPVIPNAGFGIYYIYYNDFFDRFTKDKGFLPPDKKYLSERKTKNDLRKYYRLYIKTYGYTWGFDQWQLMYADLYYEAYKDSLRILGPYLYRNRPLFFRDYFNSHIIKQKIKSVLGRCEENR